MFSHFSVCNILILRYLRIAKNFFHWQFFPAAFFFHNYIVMQVTITAQYYGTKNECNNYVVVRSEQMDTCN